LLDACLGASKQETAVRGLDNGIVDFVKIGILCSQDETMKGELAGKANEMRELFTYVTTQADLFKKISRGIEQITVEYSLRDILPAAERSGFPTTPEQPSSPQ